MLGKVLDEVDLLQQVIESQDQSIKNLSKALTDMVGRIDGLEKHTQKGNLRKGYTIKDVLNIGIFSPNQIKSVDNRGTFDPENPNIYLQGQISSINGNIVLEINSQEEMKNRSEIEFKNDMLDVLKGFKGRKIFNKSLNADIEIRTSSIRKYKSFFADGNKRLIVPYIPELLEKANFSKAEKSYMQEKEPNIKAYYKSDLPITIDSETFNVHLTVREDNQGNFFWDAQINKGSQHATPATNLGDTAPIDITISQSDENVNSDGKLYQKAYVSMRGELVGDYLDADEFAGTGEGAMAHGWGNYLLKDRKTNKVRYFDRWNERKVF